MDVEEQVNQPIQEDKSNQELSEEMTAPDSDNTDQYSNANVVANDTPAGTAGEQFYSDTQTGYGVNSHTDTMEMEMGYDDDGEDGEILEDGEIASDQDGELRDEQDTGELKSKSSPSKSKSHHDDDKEHKKSRRKERHSKRRRSKEDSHRDKQSKKKRHREYVDYDKADEYDSWSGGEKKDRGDKKGNKSPSLYMSPSHDGEDRGKGDKEHRRGSDSRHHSGAGRDKHRNRDRDFESDRKGKDKSPKERHEKRDKSERKDRDKHNRNSRDSKERDRKNHLSDGYESPPGIYDSPSDEENPVNRFPVQKGGTLMSMVQGEYVDPAVAPTDNSMNGPIFPKNKKKQQKRKEWLERKQQREREMEEMEKPPKKKPLLQTPMEERPQCRFFKEGKCQKGSDCPFNHGFRPPKRMEVCKYYVQSTCWNQGECVFMHEEFPCKYFHTGSTCYQGDNCKFSHDPLTDETREALDNALVDRDDDINEEREVKKFKKKGLLGDPPQLSEEQLQRKLQDMKKIPSIFDIQTHAPGESPRKPAGQSPSSVRPQGFYHENNMSPAQNGPGPGAPGPNMNFQGNRPPFMPGPGGPGMDGPPPGMQGPPMGGPGFMGPPGMGGPAPPQGPGMQGAPMGPPMNNQMSPAAALVGAILRAAPMLQQYRGPAPPGGPPTSVPTSMQNSMDPRLGPGAMGPDQVMSPNESENNAELEQSSQAFSQSKLGSASRDPRKGLSQKASAVDDVSMDTDMRDLGDVDMRGQGQNMGDVDLRQDVDMRQEEPDNKGDTTPQQDWDDDKSNDNPDDADDSMEVPEHLPPKQREMFMRIKQMSMKIKKDQTAKANASSQAANEVKKIEDDKWYSSDEDDDQKTDDAASSQNALNQPSGAFTNTSMSSSMNIMQMINAVKSTTPSTNAQRSNEQMLAQSPAQEPTVIHSRDGDCPWRLCRVLYVKQKIPSNIDLNDAKYKADPRVQKMLKMQELEFGKIIDHSKVSVKVEPPPTIEPKLPDLLDPKVFKQLPKPELTAFVDPRSSKKENADPRIKQETSVGKPVDPRFQRHSDPRLARQDSNTSSSSAVTVKPGPRPHDPRLSRQTSATGSPTYSVSIPPPSPTMPLDPRMMGRSPSSDPRLSKSDTMPLDTHPSSNRPADPRIGRVMDSDLGPPSVHRQFSNPGTRDERDVASSEHKPKLDYRNDPRFKRKHISESNLSPTSASKRFPEQRKTTTEYSSPLGGDNNSQTEESGYNSYNRRAVKQQQNLQKMNESVPMPSEEISTHDILDSLQIMAPPVLEKPDKNLKDIFKTIDPTASPFC